MIEIPYLVKKALKNGRYRKNYRFKVYKNMPAWEDLCVFTGHYDVYEDNSYRIYVDPSEGRLSSVSYTKDGAYRGESFPPSPYPAVTEWEESFSEEDSIDSVVTSPEGITVKIAIPGTAPEHVFTIDNDTLVRESVNIDERMCSGTQLKFGLCEGSSLEFQYFNHPNIRGDRIQAFLDVQYKDAEGVLKWHEIPMGWYDVDECSTQFSTGIKKVTAYNKLRSSYLDRKANSLIAEMPVDSKDNTVSLYSVQKVLLADYGIEEKPKESVPIVIPGHGDFIGEYDTTLTFKLVGDSNTYYISAVHNADAATESVYFNAGKILEISDISGYINLLEQKMTSIKKAVYEKVVNPDVFWEKLKDSVNEWGMQVYFHNEGAGGVLYYYTIPEMVSGNNQNRQSLEKLKTLRDVWEFQFIIPSSIDAERNVSGGVAKVNIWNSDESLPLSLFDNKLFVYDMSELTEAELIPLTPSTLPDVTLRELQSASYETVCQFGQLDRETDLFSGVELNGGGLFPATNLYPATTRYPEGEMVHPFPSEYQKLWTDTVGEQSFRYLIITYKTLELVDGSIQQVEKTLQRTVNADGTTNYNMSQNWLFLNLIWDPETVGEYADAMVEKMRGIRWFPFEMWSVGLPHLETGDAVEITDKEGETHVSYILQRTLKGIHNLQDTYTNGELDVF